MATGDIVIVTPVRPGAEDDLRSHLRRLDLHTGPLGGMRRSTHFARFVVVALDGYQLFFSSRFDGDPAVPAAQAIWSFCDSAAADDVTRLRSYLDEHSIRAPYILAAWSDHTVAEVNAAVGRRAQLQRFAVRAARLEPTGLARAFREEFRR